MFSSVKSKVSSGLTKIKKKKKKPDGTYQYTEYEGQEGQD